MCSRYGYYEKALDETEALATIIEKGIYEVPFGEIGPVDHGSPTGGADTKYRV